MPNLEPHLRESIQARPWFSTDFQQVKHAIMDCEAQWAWEIGYIFRLRDVLLIRASQRSPFSPTLTGSQLHFMVLQFVAEQHELLQLNFYGLTACFLFLFLFFFVRWEEGEEDVRETERNHKEEAECEYSLCSLPRPSNCPLFLTCRRDLLKGDEICQVSENVQDRPLHFY